MQQGLFPSTVFTEHYQTTYLLLKLQIQPPTFK
jgi:hypothetical protein